MTFKAGPQLRHFLLDPLCSYRFIASVTNFGTPSDGERHVLESSVRAFATQGSGSVHPSCCSGPFVHAHCMTFMTQSIQILPEDRTCWTGNVLHHPWPYGRGFFSNLPSL